MRKLFCDHYWVVVGGKKIDGIYYKQLQCVDCGKIKTFKKLKADDILFNQGRKLLW